MFVAQTGARQDDTGVARVLDVDGKARWQQCGVARFQRGVSVNTGTQIKTGRAFTGVFGQCDSIANSWVENDVFNTVHCT